MDVTPTSVLAIHGGPKTIPDPLPDRGLITSAEKASAMAVFDRSIESGKAFGYNGEEEEGYCREFAQMMGGGFADAVNSGTNALYIALRSLNLDPFSEVVVPPVTDPGGMMPVPLMNCIPVVADSAPGCYNTGPRQIEEVLSPLTRAIVVAHIGGEPADMVGICELAAQRGIPVVEDCAQAHGASISGQKVGSFGDVAAFSTMFGKHHCTGGQGGVVFTRDAERHAHIRRLADRGKPFGRPAGATNEVAALNCNLDELSCAIGRAQLSRLPDMIRRRQAVAERLRLTLERLDTIRIPAVIPGGEHVYWWWRLDVVQERMNASKTEYCEALCAEGVRLNPDYSVAMPQRMAWFKNRCVFGNSSLPWSSPDYKGDATREFPCPNALAAMAAGFNLDILERWGEREADAISQAFVKVDQAFRR